MQLQKFNIIVHGCSAHGSTPHLSKDAIVAASNIILNLQLLISRVKDPLAEEVLTLTQVKSGTQFNIITDRAELVGVLGAADKVALEQLHAAVENIVSSSAAPAGCTAEVIYGEYVEKAGE